MDHDQTAMEPAPARVLLVDDSEIERTALAHFLRDAGYSVDEAGNGDSAINHLKNQPVDLMLLDLRMPGSDGFTVLGYLQEHRRSLPVILMSGMQPDNIQDEMRRLRERELPPLLMKPIDPDQLVALVELELSGALPPVGAEDWNVPQAGTEAQ